MEKAQDVEKTLKTLDANGNVALPSRPRIEFILMIMKSIFLFFALAVSSYQFSLAEGGGVAILDIDSVAKRLGIEEQVKVELTSLQKRLAQELQKTKAQLETEMKGVQKAAGENPSETQLRELRATSQQLNSEFARLKTQSEQSLRQEKTRLVNEFRIKLEPIAKNAAAERGLDVVLMKVTPPVFTFTPEVDITEATYRLAVEAGLQVEASGAETPKKEKDGSTSE